MKRLLLFLMVGMFATALFAQSGTIEIKNVEYDCYYDDEYGMKIHSCIKVNGWKGKTVEYAVFFYKGDNGSGGPLISPTDLGIYSATNGQVCTYYRTESEYENCVWENWWVFLPYRVLPHVAGKNNYSFYGCVRKTREYNSEDFATTPYVNFNVTFNSSSNSNTNSSSNSTINPLQEVQEANRRLGNSIYYYKTCDICKGYKNCIYCNGHGRCQTCNGSNVCQTCHGNKKVNYPVVGWITCASCGGNGQCTPCQYTGRCICHRFKGTAGKCYRCEGQGMIKELLPQYAGGYVPAGGGGGNSSFNNNSGGGKIQCSSCGGTGKCRMCGGSGVSVGTDNYNCKTCYGTKKCPGCRGNGYY